MSLLDSGLAVVGKSLTAAPLSSQAINMLLSSEAGRPIGKMGLYYAAGGGRYSKGILVWNTPEGATEHFAFPMNPEELTETLTPNYAEIQVPGQNYPMHHFVNGGPRTLAFKLHFFYEDRKRDAISKHINTFRLLCRRPYRKNTRTNSYGPPPPVFLYFGEFIRGERFIMTGLSIRTFDLFDPTLLLPMRAELSITLTESVDTSSNPSVPTAPGGFSAF